MRAAAPGATVPRRGQRAARRTPPARAPPHRGRGGRPAVRCRRRTRPPARTSRHDSPARRATRRSRQPLGQTRRGRRPRRSASRRAGSEDVLHRLAEAEIGGQRQRRHELGEPDLRWIGQPLHAWHEHSPPRPVSQATRRLFDDVVRHERPPIRDSPAAVRGFPGARGWLWRWPARPGAGRSRLPGCRDRSCRAGGRDLPGRFARGIRRPGALRRASVASRALRDHIHDLAGALSKLQRLLVPGGRLIVDTPLPADERTAGWSSRIGGLRTRMHRSRCTRAWPSGKQTTPGWTATPRCGGSSACASPNAGLRGRLPLLELGEALEGEELSLIEDGSIQATGFEYVGEWSG